MPVMQLTANQRHVLLALQQAEEPLGAYTLLDRLRGNGFNAPTQIYRALQRLIGHGLVHRLESLNAYVSCHHTSGCEHGVAAFAICRQCGHVAEFVDEQLGACMQRLAQDNTFTVHGATIELHGMCASCGGTA